MRNHNDKWYEFTVNLTLKINRGSLGIKYDHQGEFIFCAQSPHHARSIAGYHVKDSVSTINTTRIVEIVGSIRVSREVLPLESPGLKSLTEVASELDELEYA